MSGLFLEVGCYAETCVKFVLGLCSMVNAGVFAEGEIYLPELSSRHIQCPTNSSFSLIS